LPPHAFVSAIPALSGEVVAAIAGAIDWV